MGSVLEGSASLGQTLIKNSADNSREASARVTSLGTCLLAIEVRGLESAENCMKARRASERVNVVSTPAKSLPIESALNHGCTTNININGLFRVNWCAS